MAGPDERGRSGEEAGGASATRQVIRRIVDALTDTQRRALALMAEGKSIGEAAQAVGVNRGTVYRWLKADPHFRAAYNAWQLEQRESRRAALLRCAEQAVAKIVRMVDIDDRVALKVVKELGLFARPEPLDMDPDRVQREIDIEQWETEARLEQRQARGQVVTHSDDSAISKGIREAVAHR